MLHAIADLKATLRASVFFTDVQNAIRKANSFDALTATAHLLDCPEFKELPKEVQDDLDAQFEAKVLIITGGGVL